MSNETARVTAQRVVERLLSEDCTPDDFNKRPGGKEDPLRAGGGTKLTFKKGAFSGKRPGESKKEKDKKNPRFGIKFQKETVAEGKGAGVKKAWKQGKKSSGKAVAGKPGKVSYREAIMRRTLANLEEKRKMGSGMKGATGGKKNVGTVAKKPGSVGYGKK